MTEDRNLFLVRDPGTLRAATVAFGVTEDRNTGDITGSDISGSLAVALRGDRGFQRLR
ncbi:hypothetical protein [Streptomyces galilaeus]|uniref:Uncharacterized protein n=1 Tax=Streptomyces galilaeus TaxID=33899 RepID=A0ABW9IXL8_STRGJ